MWAKNVTLAAAQLPATMTEKRNSARPLAAMHSSDATPTWLLKVWGYESDAEDNNVEVYISFLRKKLDHLHSQVKIRTIRMVGYCLEAPEEA